MSGKVNNVSVEFVALESDLAACVNALKSSGGTVTENEKAWDTPPDLLDDYSDAQFEPMMVVAASVSIGFLIKRISDVWLDHKRAGGQVIDTRGKDVSIRWAPHLDRGKLVVVSSEETKVYESKDHDEALDVLEKIVGAHG